MTAIYLKCLGSLEVQLRGDMLAKFATDRARALLIFLAIESGKSHRRETLAGLLWGGKPDKVARQSLRQAMFRLRKGTGGLALLQADYKEVRLNSDILAIDYHQFQNLLTLPHTHHNTLCPTCLTQLTEAATLVRGEFLQGFYLSDALKFEEWVHMIRNQIRQQTWQLYDQLARHGMATKRHELTIEYSQKQLAIDPWEEVIQRRYLRALALAKQRQKAIAHFDTYAALLAADIQANPQPETIQLMTHIRENALHKVMGELHNFPAQATSFIGRTTERETVLAQLQRPECRMVTLLGAGGVGKTRLAIEVAQHLTCEQFANGVYFVPLVTATTAYDTLAILHRTLALPMQGSDIEAQLFEHLRDKQLLLLLDNVEQLTGELRFLARLLQTAKGVKVLATSRDVVGISAEHRYPVSGIDDSHEASAILWEAIKRITPDFELTAVNQTIGAQICEQLHGVPLALELAATWINTLDLDSIREEIEHTYTFLESPLLDTPNRHRSLSAIFEHSWQLLQPQRQNILAGVSIFRGGFDMAAARTILAANVHDLRRLVEQSLLVKSPSSTQKTRYTLHELVRQFAAKKLSETDDEPLYHAHAHHYLTLVANHTQMLIGEDALIASERISNDLANVTSAWQWAVKNRLIDMLNAAVIPMTRFYRLTGRYSQGNKLFIETVEQLGEQADAALLARLHVGCATCRMWQAQYDKSIESAKKALHFAELANDQTMIAASLNCWGRALRTKGEFKPAVQKLQQGLAACDNAATNAIRSEILTHLSIITSLGTDLLTATQLSESALTASRQSGDKMIEAYSLAISSFIRTQTCHVTEAITLANEGLALSRQLGNRLYEALALNMRGRAYLFIGEYTRANKDWRKSRALYQSVGDQLGEILALAQLSRSYFEVGDFEDALHYCTLTLALAEARGTIFHKANALQWRGLALCGTGRHQAAQQVFEELGRLRVAHGWPQQYDYLVQAGLGEIAFRQGAVAEALAHTTNLVDKQLRDHAFSFDSVRRCLVLFNILKANDDPRAISMLQHGYNVTMKNMSHIEDVEQRRLYLEQVPQNRALLATYEKECAEVEIPTLRSLQENTATVSDSDGVGR